MNMLKHKACLIVVLAVISAGCAQQHLTLRQQNDINPSRLRPDAPLVLAIPGLNLPGEPLRQQNHFGNLVQMLADKGIPAKVLAYDTDEYPLTSVANLGFDQTSIATTRVTPFLDSEVDAENARRAALKLPPVKELVIFGFSQGSVIGSRIVARINYFKKEYAEFCARFGPEWTALQNDPEFLYFKNALVDYIAVHDIKVQREKDFQHDRDFQFLFDHLYKKLDVQGNDFFEYLMHPEKKYPQADHFEPINTPKYPKKYPMFSAYVREGVSSPEKKEALKEFFINYASFDSLLDVKIRFISTAGSFFGSPNANVGFAMAEVFLPAKLFIGRELNQIKDTRLGSEQQLQGVRYLYETAKMGWYPFADKDTLFILGVNGIDRGDGMVDQSSAHIADHICVVVKKGQDARPQVTVQRLPDFVVVPLHFTHLPEETLAWKTMGASYMVEGNPVFDYLVDFINNDWDTIHKKLAADQLHIRQFMVEICQFDTDKNKITVRRTGNSKNVEIDRQFVNPDSHAVVWSGHFAGPNQFMNLSDKEDVTGSVTIEYWTDRKNKSTVDLPISPGCNTFVAIKAE